ncbi:GntR family transcriptional regulator [Acuticoccus mangrovi]|uniref:GntR family transcriptional regulator n=1 Tax=Acuticoccus mangrovi TaxID=2796142 RepID=UPI001B3BBD0A
MVKPPPARGHGEAGVSAASRSPLYHQIYLIYRDEILAGSHKAGDRLPSEHELARLYGVSRITAKRALSELADAGLVRRHRGRGTTVAYERPDPPLRASAANWLRSLAAMGRDTTVEVLEFSYGAANGEEADALALQEGAEVQRSLRRRSHAGEPFSLLATVLPAAIGRTFDEATLETTPLIALMRAAGVGIGEARQAISATLANQATAAHLGIDVGAPLLKVQRVVHATSGAPVEYLTALYRPDRYQLDMVLTTDERLTDVAPLDPTDPFAASTES